MMCMNFEQTDVEWILLCPLHTFMCFFFSVAIILYRAVLDNCQGPDHMTKDEWIMCQINCTIVIFSVTRVFLLMASIIVLVFYGTTKSLTFLGSNVMSQMVSLITIISGLLIYKKSREEQKMEYALIPTGRRDTVDL